MASFSKRGKHWRAQIRTKGQDPISRTFDTKTQAQIWALPVDNEMDHGIYINRSEAERTTLEILGRSCHVWRSGQALMQLHQAKSRSCPFHPRSPMYPNLRDTLANFCVDDLKQLVAFLPTFQLGTRKEELITAICNGLLGDGLAAAWQALTDQQQSAVAEATHDFTGRHHAAQFEAKYRHIACLREKHKRKDYPDSEGRLTRLALFIYPDRRSSTTGIPPDLQARLRNFVPKPCAASILSQPTLPDRAGLMQRQTEQHALHELAVLLRSVETERLSVSDKTAVPSSAATRLIGTKLPAGDFYPLVEKTDKYAQEIGPIKAFAWPMLLQAGKLAQRNGTRLALTPAGIKARATPPAEVLRNLWDKWVDTGLFDEFSRVDAIKGQGGSGRVMTAADDRREQVNIALSECPSGVWIDIEEFSRFVRAAGYTFEVTQDPWRLYLGDRQYGALGYAGFHDWSILQGRFIRALLFEYAATLGLIDVAYVHPKDADLRDFRRLWGVDELDYLSRYDGLCHFRINALGAFVLGQTNSYQPQTPASAVALLVLPSLSIQLMHGSLTPDAALLLETWAEPMSDSSWQLDRQRTMAAIESGHDIQTLRTFLQGQHSQPLPDTVASFINRCAQDATALKLGASAVLIECRDATTAQLLAEHKQTRKLCLRAADQTLVVRAEQLEKFRAAVRGLGLGLMG